MDKVTAVVLTKNEESKIKQALSSIRWCSEIVLVDDYSTDRTCQIAKRFGARVYRRHLNGDFSAQRNFALEKAKEEWVLFIDADERISKKLASEISKKNVPKKISGYLIKRQDFWMGKRLEWGEWGGIKLLRLGRKSKGKWIRKVHEYWKIRGEVDILENKIIHIPHSSISEFLRHVNFHASLHAEENLREGKKSNVTKIFFYPILKFGSNYFIRQGFRDGNHGFVFAVFMSFHSFLAWSKQWLDSRKLIG